MNRPGLLMLVRRDLWVRPVRNGILIVCVAAVVGMQVAAALIDIGTVPGSEYIPRMLRLLSCHVPFIACVGGEFRDEDDIYDLGFNALIYKDAKTRRIREIIGNFLPVGHRRGIW